MTTGEAIRAVLEANAGVLALVAGRIFPSFMPQGTAMPAVVYQVISDVPENSMTSEVATRISAIRLQVDSYGEKYLDAQQLAAAVDAVLGALGGADLAAQRVSLRDLYDDEAQLHRASAEYIVFR